MPAQMVYTDKIYAKAAAIRLDYIAYTGRVINADEMVYADWT